MPRLLHELAVGRGDGSYARLLTRLAKLDLLAIDDWMIAPLRDAERRDLTEVIEDRAERASTLIASQLPVTDWHAVIGDSNQADAICDRLLHDTNRIELKGRSMRLTHRAPKTRTPGDDMSIPTAACTPAASSPAGGGRPMDRTGGMENAHDTLAPECTGVEARFHTALDGTERRPYAPQARSLYSSNTTSRVASRAPVAKPIGRTLTAQRRCAPTSVPFRRNPCSRSPESVFHFSGICTVPGLGREARLGDAPGAPRRREAVRRLRRADGAGG